MPTSLWVQLIVFLACGLLATLAQSRFYQALWSREPGAASPPSAAIERLAEQPSRFIPAFLDATRARLSALIHRSPYPEVERKRRLALASLVPMLLALVWFAFPPGQ